MNLFNLSIEILTILSVFAALAVITSTNPVIAIIFLITLFLLVSIYLILMGLTFIGLSYLLVYIGGIVVFFLFIIMMIAPDYVQTIETKHNYSKLLPLAYSMSVLLLILFLLLIPSFTMDFHFVEIFNSITTTIYSIYFKVINIFNFNNDNLDLYNVFNYNIDASLNYNNIDVSSFKTHIRPSEMFSNVLQIRSIGEYLYGPGSIALILSAILLLLALVAPIVLTKNSNQ